MKRAWLLAPTLFTLTFGACVGDTPSTNNGTSGNSADAANGSSGTSGTSSGNLPGDASNDGPNGCAEPATCSASSLVQCGAVVDECALGCVSEANGARCRSFDPTGALKSNELRLDGLNDLVLNDDYVFDTDTGAVQRIGADGQRTELRAANEGDAASVGAGIGYRRLSDRGVFFFRSLRVDAGVPRNVRGALPLTVVADSITIPGQWILPCGRAGGGSFEAPGLGAGGAGQAGTLPAPYVGGGGGAGHAIGGGIGLETTNKPISNKLSGAPGAAGVAYGGLPFEPLLGGSLGGLTSAEGTEAGRGGAALQLIARQNILVGGSDAVAAGISVGGCGGKTPLAYSGGGGGGSGGTLLLEAPTIRLERGALLAANGGAGGASAVPESSLDPAPENDPAGAAVSHLGPGDGALSIQAAGSPPTESLDYYFGGRGGSAATPEVGQLAAVASSYWVRGSERRASGPGGGGSYGYIHLISKDGSAFREPSAATSPSAAPYFALSTLVIE